MAKSSSKALVTFSPSRQVAFHQLLVAARKTWLTDGLREALARVDPRILKQQLVDFVPPDAQQFLASAGVRDEWVFPVPILLEAQPTLVGYYRLLLGISQKMFYRTGTGMSSFKSMEATGNLTGVQRGRLPEFCKAMSAALSEMVRQLSPNVTERDVRELHLLTLGAQFQGGNNVAIGKQATIDGFVSMAEVVKEHIVRRSARQIAVTNASGREVLISLAGDPDVRIEERFDSGLQRKVAIEIKGGTDVSNVHNRVGEAEKSHQKAKGEGFIDFWTIIQIKGVNLNKLKSESPTTNAWFDAAQVLGRQGDDWERFRRRVSEAVGIPVT